jgi:hypothetical protein
MLDSGEADTMIYSNGRWVKNTGALAPISSKTIQREFLRRFLDKRASTDFTGFYVPEHPLPIYRPARL